MNQQQTKPIKQKDNQIKISIEDIPLSCSYAYAEVLREDKEIKLFKQSQGIC